jgi:hypothetical protein
MTAPYQPPIGNDITTLFNLKFSNLLVLLLQQRGSVMRSHVETKAEQGRLASPVNQIASYEAHSVDARFTPMQNTVPLYDRRWYTPITQAVSVLVDQVDLLKTITDPKSQIAQSSSFAIGRQFDYEMAQAFFRPAVTGENAQLFTDFPSSQIIAADTDAAVDVGLTVAKLIEAQRIMRGNYVEVDSGAERIIAVMTSKQISDLQKDLQYTSSEYSDQLVLENGRVKSFMGMEIVHYEDQFGVWFVEIDSVPYRTIPVYSMKGMGLGIWKDMNVRIDPRTDLEEIPWQVYCTATYGATRIEENRVIQIICSEAAYPPTVFSSRTMYPTVDPETGRQHAKAGQYMPKPLTAGQREHQKRVGEFKSAEKARLAAGNKTSVPVSDDIKSAKGGK